MIFGTVIAKVVSNPITKDIVTNTEEFMIVNAGDMNTAKQMIERNIDYLNLSHKSVNYKTDYTHGDIVEMDAPNGLMFAKPVTVFNLK